MVLDNLWFKLWYVGKNNTINVVGFIIDVSLRDEVVDVMRKVDRIISLKLVFEKQTINIIRIYASQVV